MPGKSRYGKGKHHRQSKKSKAIRRQGTAAATPAATGTPAAVAPPVKAVPSPKSAAIPSKTTVIGYPYITGELKRIGILAGIAIIILFILSFVIS